MHTTSVRSRLLAAAAAASALGILALLAPPAIAGSGQAVDIYLSTGTGSCNPDEDSACDIVRVRMDLGGSTAKQVENVVRHESYGEDGSGAVEPGVSPDGTRLAWIERVGHSWQLYATELSGHKPHLIAKSGPPKEGGIGVKPGWPAWIGNDTLLFDAKNGSDGDTYLKTVYSISVKDLGNPGSVTPRLGAKATGGMGVEDAAVRQTGSGIEIATFGPVQSGGSTVYQLEVDKADNSGKPVGSAIRPSLGLNKSGKPIEGCHHPAWNPSGDTILCMEHKPAEKIGDMPTKVLYSFKRQADGTFANAGRTFEPPEMSASGLAIASKLSASAGCTDITWKYAQFCASDDYVVSTLYCSTGAKSSGRGATVGASRVVLVHTNPVSLVDVTELVEKEKGLATGALSSFTGTCAPVN